MIISSYEVAGSFKVANQSVGTTLMHAYHKFRVGSDNFNVDCRYKTKLAQSNDHDNLTKDPKI